MRGSLFAGGISFNGVTSTASNIVEMDSDVLNVPKLYLYFSWIVVIILLGNQKVWSLEEEDKVHNVTAFLLRNAELN